MLIINLMIKKVGKDDDPDDKGEGKSKGSEEVSLLLF